MIKRTINLGFEIEKIFQISDIHIKLYKKHSDYKKVFERTYDLLKKQIKHEPNSIIYVGGDIVHSKTDMSPELVSIVSDFLTNLTDIAPTLVITGNHDVNLNNIDRLDVLKPIIDIMNNDRLFYLRDTGIYTIGNIDFFVYSVFDEPQDWPAPSESTSNYKICLVHTPINSSKLDSGMEIESSNNIPKNLFDGFDLVMAGDIHKQQTLQTYSFETKEINQEELDKYLKSGWQVYE